MYGFCSDGTSPAPSRGTCATVANGLATKRRREREERARAAQERHQVRHQLARAPAVLVGDERREAAEHEQPEQQRALLARPERRDQVRLRHLARGVLGDAREAEVVAHDGGREHAGGDGDADEAAGERAPRARHEALVVQARADDRRDRRVDRREQREQQRPSAQQLHQRLSGSLRRRDGCRRVLRRALRAQRVVARGWKAAPCTLPSIRIARPSRNAEGTEPW